MSEQGAPDGRSDNLSENRGFLSMFSSSKSGVRRSILFTLAVATGFITIVAATSATIGQSLWWVAPLLWVVGLVIFLFAIMIAFGRFESLVSDEQYFWSMKRNK